MSHCTGTYIKDATQKYVTQYADDGVVYPLKCFETSYIKIYLFQPFTLLSLQIFYCL